MKNVLLVLAFFAGLVPLGISQTIYRITPGGHQLLEGLDRMVNEQNTPSTIGTTNYTNQNNPNATASRLHSASLAVNTSYVHMNIDNHINYTTVPPGACSTAVYGLNYMTVTMARYQEPGSGQSNKNYAHFIWSEDPSLGLGFNAYNHYLGGGAQLMPTMVTGQHHHPAGLVCNPGFRNHVYYLYLFDQTGTNITWEDVDDIVSYEMESDINNVPTQCSNCQGSPVTNIHARYAQVGQPSGIKLRVKLFSGTTVTAWMYSNYTSLKWKEPLSPCMSGVLPPCNYIGVSFDELNPSWVTLTGPKYTYAGSQKPLFYYWTIDGGPQIVTTTNQLTMQMMASGHHDFEMFFRAADDNTNCYEESELTHNHVYVPDPGCFYPAPPFFVQLPPSPQAFNSEVISSLPQNQLQENAVNVYPNPTKGRVSVDLDPSKSFDYSIIDIKGMVVKRGQFVSGGSRDLDLSEHAKGIYIMTWTDGQATSATRFVVE